jgi:hypothetical protein
VSEPISEYKLTPHSLMKLEQRGISEEQLRQALRHPERRVPVRKGRDVLQRKFQEQSQEYLIRVFVDTDRIPPEVVTAYKTSKLKKYGEPSR